MLILVFPKVLRKLQATYDQKEEDENEVCENEYVLIICILDGKYIKQNKKCKRQKCLGYNFKDKEHVAISHYQSILTY